MEKYERYGRVWRKKWLEGQLAKKSIYLVARETGCSYANVYWVMEKLGISLEAIRNQNVKIKNRENPTDMRQNIEKALKKKYPNGRFGKDAANYRGGRVMRGPKAAYWAILSSGHPNADKTGYVMEHRLVMEKHLGRLLKKTEIVHHKNGIKTDNRIENLELLKDRGTHIREHFERSHITETTQLDLKSLQEKYDTLMAIVNACDHCREIAKKQELC